MYNWIDPRFPKLGPVGIFVIFEIFYFWNLCSSWIFMGNTSFWFRTSNIEIKIYGIFMVNHTTYLLGFQLNRDRSNHCLVDIVGEDRNYRLTPTIPCWKGIFMVFETNYIKYFKFYVIDMIFITILYIVRQYTMVMTIYQILYIKWI